MKTDYFIIYHDDADGIISALITFKYIKAIDPDSVIKVSKINYGDNYELIANIEVNKKIYVVDFFDEPLLDILLDRFNIDIEVYDHHKTTLERMVKYKNINRIKIEYISEPYVSACKYLIKRFKDVLIKKDNRYYSWLYEIADNVSIWDTWNKDAVKYFVDIYYFKTAVEILEFHSLVNENMPLHKIRNIQDMVSLLERSKAVTNLKSMVKAKWNINGNKLSVALFNTPFRSSMLYEIPLHEELIEDFNPDIIMAFNYNSEGIVTVSMYQYSNKEIDLGSIARTFGGGGHIGAAGFQCKQLVIDNKNINIVSL